MIINETDRQELVDLLFEVDDCFITIKQNLEYINKVYSLDDLHDFKYMLRLSTNDLLFYSRALRDKLNE